MLLVATDEAGARGVCERMRSAIAAASPGVAEAAPGQTIEDVLARADAALYRAKASGRNRIAAASEAVPAEG